MRLLLSPIDNLLRGCFTQSLQANLKIALRLGNQGRWSNTFFTHVHIISSDSWVLTTTQQSVLLPSKLLTALRISVQFLATIIFGEKEFLSELLRILSKMAGSKPTSSLSKSHTPFTLNHWIPNFNFWFGLPPFDKGPIYPLSVCPLRISPSKSIPLKAIKLYPKILIRYLMKKYNNSNNYSIFSLTQHPMWTHYFNSFRRKPAISKSDWAFPPNHRSSEVFATTTGSFFKTAHG